MASSSGLRSLLHCWSADAMRMVKVGITASGGIPEWFRTLAELLDIFTSSVQIETDHRTFRSPSSASSPVI